MVALGFSVADQVLRCLGFEGALRIQTLSVIGLATAAGTTPE